MENAVIQMLETWLSTERLLSNSTPRFLTDEEELTEYVIQGSSFFGMGGMLGCLRCWQGQVTTLPDRHLLEPPGSTG